ncbi:MAG: glycoside hydrolase family 38 N-terminal domain-containing protein, partial [Planctomycetota bacterium]
MGKPAFGQDISVGVWEVHCVKPGPIKLKIYRRQKNAFKLIAESPVEQMKQGFNRFKLPTPIPVKKGDLVGFHISPGAAVAEDLQGGEFYHRNGDINDSVSSTASWTQSTALSSVRAYDEKFHHQLARVDNILNGAKLIVRSMIENRTVDWANLEADGNTRFLDLSVVDEPTLVSITLASKELRLSRQVIVKPEKKWKIYLFHSIHIDIGYTNPQEVVTQRLTDNLDKLMDYHEGQNALMRELKPAWNCEVAWVIDEYQRRRTPQQFERLVSHLKKGNITAQALFCNSLSGLYGPEDLVRLLYFTAGLKHKHGVPILSAKQTDTPNYTYVLPSILANAGIKYFSLGQNRQVAGRRPQVCPFYWVGPDGKEILVWHSQGYYRSSGAGGSWRSIQDRIRVSERESDICDAVGYHGLHGDNTSFRPHRYEHYLNLIKSWNRRWAYPKIIVGTPYDMLGYLEKKFGPDIPRLRGDWGCDWEDGAASSAHETGINRRAKNLLHTGESLAAIASAVCPNYTYPRKCIDETYRNALLYDEHTWGSGESVSEPEGEDTKKQWAVKSAFAKDALNGARSLNDHALETLAGVIPTGDEITILVYNPLSWMRTDVAVVSLPVSLRNKKAIQVIDSSNNQMVASQREGENLVFLARDIPSLGYRAFRLKEIDVRTPSSIVCKGNMIENRYYKVILDPATGAVAGIYDKQLNRELVDRAGPYRFNQYIYDNDGVRDMKYRRKGQEPPAGGKHGPEQATIKTGIIGPVRGSIVSNAKALMTPSVGQEIILYSDLKRIDLVNRLKKNLTYKVEQVYYAFPFAVDKPNYI